MMRRGDGGPRASALEQLELVGLAFPLLRVGRRFLAILSGDDPTAVRAMLEGADGVISVAANVCPAAFARLCRLARSGGAEAARALDTELAPLWRFLGIEPNPIPAKWLLARQGRIASSLRLPLTELSAVHHAAANEMLALLDRVERGGGASRAA